MSMAMARSLLAAVLVAICTNCTPKQEESENLLQAQQNQMEKAGVVEQQMQQQLDQRMENSGPQRE